MQVTENYVFDNNAPIELCAGDAVRLGELTDSNSDYPNWIHCESLKTGRKGWVAVDFLTINGDIGIATRDYTAKEMTVSVGDIVDTKYELNGWYWSVRQSDSESGWIDKKMVK
jgi:hypothetical protein